MNWVTFTQRSHKRVTYIKEEVLVNKINKINEGSEEEETHISRK